MVAGVPHSNSENLQAKSPPPKKKEKKEGSPGADRSSPRPRHVDHFGHGVAREGGGGDIVPAVSGMIAIMLTPDL